MGSEERRVHIGGVSTIRLFLSLQIWDLRNMRSPVDSIRQDCGVNRLSVSHDERGLLAVPLDNRHIKLYDSTGSRVAHLPRRNRQVPYLLEMTPRRLLISQLWREVTIPVIQGVRLGRCL